MRKLALIVTVAVLAGCSTFAQQKQLAQENRWEQVGLIDGQTGHYQKAAPELEQFGSLSDMALSEYRQGYQKGIAEFCQPEAAFRRGLTGTKYKGQCSGLANENEVVKRWLDGSREYRFNQAITSLSDGND